MKRIVAVKHWIAVAFCMATMFPTSARAGSGSIASVPLPGVKVTTGLSLNVNTEWVDGNGYRPVTISISPLGGVAAPADRVLDVTLRPRGWRWRAAMPSVSTTIMLEQGQTVAEKTVEDYRNRRPDRQMIVVSSAQNRREKTIHLISHFFCQPPASPEKKQESFFFFNSLPNIGVFRCFLVS